MLPTKFSIIIGSFGKDPHQITVNLKTYTHCG